MDFSKFRASGDLSDLVVMVEGQENHLHRFPLYAKSEFFCGLARGPGSQHSVTKSRVELPEFPGGQAMFSLVADFCYNMAPPVTRDNVVHLRAAAHLLQMAGPGNLADVTDKFMQDTLSSAKLNRSSSTPVSLLLHCTRVGPLAASSGVVDTCTEALVDIWLRTPSKVHPAIGNFLGPGGGGASGSGTGLQQQQGFHSAFTSLQGSAFTPMKPSATSSAGSNGLTSSSSSSAVTAGGLSSGDGGGGGTEAMEEWTVSSLCQLPAEWFASLLTKASNRGVRQSVLAEMAVRFVSRAIDGDRGCRETGAGLSNTAGGSSRGVDGDGIRSSNVNGHSTPVDGQGEAEDQDGVLGTPEDTSTAEGDLDKDVDSLEDGVAAVRVGVQPTPSPRDPAVDLGKLLDTVLTILPEEAYNLPSLTMEWLTKVLRIATARGCTCRRFLVKIAADMLTRLPAEDLCLVSPSVLHDIVEEARVDEGQAERACGLVDTYLTEMSRKGVLTAETYRLLANAAPTGVRRNHDDLYGVLEYVLKAEKDSLTSEQRRELVSTINLDLVSEETLNRALDSGLVSAEPVARASLKLCSGLRSELESVKYIAQMQEEELHKMQGRSSSLQSSPRSQALAPVKIDSDSGFSDNCHDPKGGSDSTTDHVRAAQSVLTSARTKLAMPLYTGHRPYTAHAHPSSAFAGTLSASMGGLEPGNDGSLQDELEFRLDRSSFRSLEPRSRSRHAQSSYGGSSTSGGGSSSSHHHGHHRSTYFPYSSARY